MNLGTSHLSWCLNIYPGESWQDTRANIRTEATQVRKLLSENPLSAKFLKSNGLGLGMRIAAQCAREMVHELNDFKKELAELGFYVFTINAFPYGNFHQKPVKQNVYYPDWSSQERIDYTVNTAKILAQLLPENISGSISTVPVTYGKKLPHNAIENLLITAQKFAEIEELTGKRIQLALEPEPDCYLETTAEAITFFNLLRNKDKSLAERYLGICLDTCHMALQFENPLESLNKLLAEQVPVPKIQISSVLSLDATKHSTKALEKFNEEVYLHQTLVRDEQKISQFSDLGDALRTNPKGEWRIHFHVPLYFNTNNDGVSSTSYLLDEKFINKAFTACPHLETETYTYSVLPNASLSINNSITQELLFVLEKLNRIKN